MTDDIHIHRLRRAWETADSIRAGALVVNTVDLRHALERLDAIGAALGDFEPSSLYAWQLRDKIEEVLRG